MMQFCLAFLTAGVSLTLVPPSPVTEQVTLDVRAGIRNHSARPRVFDVSLFLDSNRRPLDRASLEVPPASAQGVSFRWPARGHAGRHKLTIKVKGLGYATRDIEIVASSRRSTGVIGGAWVSLVLPNEREGAHFNTAMRGLNEHQWREVVRGIHELGMNTIVLEEAFRNEQYHGRHSIERDGYHGLAFYPSRLFPGRAEIGCPDPIEAILSEADRLDMHTFVGVGMYAWFDFTPGSLAWHRNVASELWERYGRHPSFYGWYVSEEVCGDIAGCRSLTPAETETYRMQIVDFFRGFKEHCRRLAPDKPVMLAPNSHFMMRAESTWRELMRRLDIVCPFGFHRQPEGDAQGEEVAAWLQKICDDAGAHLWMDLETFIFEPGANALLPRPIEGLVSDLERFPNFEKILCFQYPGLMAAPWASVKPGGAAAVKLFEDYKRFLKTRTARPGF